MITLPYAPGFADVPDSALAAEKFAQGIIMGRITENAATGLVRPEIFVGIYKHDDTVDLPVSPVDGYSYQRSELLYMWAVQATVNPQTGTNSVNGIMWFAQWYVDQNTGKVLSEIWYAQNDTGTKNTKSNDGTLQVFTIAQRRKTSLFISGAQPYYLEIADSALAVDKALKTSNLTQLSRNAKFSVVGSEAFYMGTYKGGQQVAIPVSPIDGYAYTAAEVKWIFSWVWTTNGDRYESPYKTFPATTRPLAQLQRLVASVDTAGNVSTQVVFYDSGEIPFSTFGRLAVAALCSRSGVNPLVANSGLASMAGIRSFSWVDPADMDSGLPLRTDKLVQVNRNTRESCLRPEVFDSGDFGFNQVVPLPVSPIDGYAYGRAECHYIWEVLNTGANSGGMIRIINWSYFVDQSSGLVSTITSHMKDGWVGAWDTQGSVRVKTIAYRDYDRTLFTTIVPPGTVDTVSSNLAGDTSNSNSTIPDPANPGSRLTPYQG